MFPKGEIKKNLLGALEIALFMRQGPARFSNDFGEMLRSWIIFFLLLPSAYLGLYYVLPHRPELSHLSYFSAFMLFTVKFAITTAIYIAILYGVAKQNKLMENFNATISALNWTGLITLALTLPAIVGVVIGHYAWPDLYNFLVLVAFYGYACSAFAMTFAMRVPWEIGVFLAVCSMALDQMSLQVIYWAASLL